jgi:hypothetical protein
MVHFYVNLVFREFDAIEQGSTADVGASMISVPAEEISWALVLLP